MELASSAHIEPFGLTHLAMRFREVLEGFQLILEPIEGLPINRVSLTFVRSSEIPPIFLGVECIEHDINLSEIEADVWAFCVAIQASHSIWSFLSLPLTHDRRRMFPGHGDQVGRTRVESMVPEPTRG